MELPCSSSQLNIDVVLLNGQSFRFTKLDSDSEYPIIQGIAHNRVWKFRRADEQTISYEVLGRFSGAVEEEDHAALYEYFQLDVDLLALYKEWSNDKNFKAQLEGNQYLDGIRVLKQDVLETFFAFICSSNNNVTRIQLMVESLCELYGEKIEIDVDDELQAFYNFPTLEQLYANREGMEEELKERKFGYRAPWIEKAVVKLHELGGRKWLEDLKLLSYKDASSALIKNFTGIGKKVADCICLMGLEMNEVVPIDTHVFKITVTSYLKDLPKEYGKLTAKNFEQIQSFWAERFGDYSGWAQCMLFTNQLRAFQPNKPKTVKRKRT